MRYVRGTIKRLAKGEGGKTRLLLERTDGSEFVAIVSNNIHIGGVGTIFNAGGFEAIEQFKGRDCYEQVEEQNVQSTVITSSSDDNPSKQIGGKVLIGKPVEADVASIELAAILNLSTQMLDQPLERVLTDINSIYKKL